MPEVERKYGAPQYVVHRADVHTAMMEQTERVAEVRVASMVVSIDFDKPSVTLANGATLEADLIVGADGKCCSSLHDIVTRPPKGTDMY